MFIELDIIGRTVYKYLSQMNQDDEDEDMPLSSPLAGKFLSKAEQGPTHQKSAPKGPGDAVMEDLTEEDEDEEDEETENHLLNLEAERADDDDEYIDDDDDDDYEEEWRPPKNASSKSSRSSTRKGKAPVTGKKTLAQDPKKSKQVRVPKLERDLEELSINDNAPEDPDDAVIVVPKKSKKTKKIVIDSDSEEERYIGNTEEDNVASPVPVVKKKRWISFN